MERLTKKKVLACGGCYTLKHTDKRGVEYMMSAFTVGQCIALYVHSKTGCLLYHKNMGFSRWKDLADVFNNTVGRIMDEDDRIHDKYACQCDVSYTDVKKAVEEWIVRYERPMTLGDAQIISDRWENRSLAMDHVYTAACAYETAPVHADFAHRHNFRVDFRL